MRNQQRINAELIFEQACAFVDCAKYTESDTFPKNKRTNSHGYVDISLSALACELFIKCLIIKNHGSYGMIHDLDQLWDIYKRDNTSRALEIENFVKDRFSSTNEDFFSEQIEKAAKAFVQWRYVFDYDANDGVEINPNFLLELRNILNKTCYSELYETDRE